MRRPEQARRTSAPDLFYVHHDLSRPLRVVGIVAAVVAPAAPATAASSSDHARAQQSATSALETGILRELNAIRRRHGLAPVRLQPSLGAAADGHSRAMAAKGFFTHESADGTTFPDRVRRYYGMGRHRYWSVGENILWSSPSVDPRRALEMWMASPRHRENILTPRWREIGIGAVHVPAAPGVYGGAPTTVVTTDFGVRR